MWRGFLHQVYVSINYAPLKCNATWILMVGDLNEGEGIGGIGAADMTLRAYMYMY